MSTAQKVRLWFMAGSTAVGLLAVIIGLSFTTGTIDGVQLTEGNVPGVLAWLLIVLVANTVLGSITLYRFINPVQPYVAFKGQYPPWQGPPQHPFDYQPPTPPKDSNG